MASRGRAGTGREIIPGPPRSKHRQSALEERAKHCSGALVLLPGGAVPDKNELCIVSPMYSHVAETALGKSYLEPSADWEQTLILISGALFQMPRLLQKFYCCGVFCLICVQNIKGINVQNHFILRKKS